MSRFSRFWLPKSGSGHAFLTIRGNVNFVGNIAGDNGGAIYASGGIQIDGVTSVAHLDVGGTATFSGNAATGSCGGAISIERQGTLAVHGDVLFQGNVGLTEGGAMHVHGGSEANISGRVVIDSNYAPLGGALYADKATIRLSDKVILSNNSAQAAGGGIFAVAGSIISLLDEVSVCCSRAQLGGAIYMDSSALKVAGCATLTGNHAGTGGMAYLANSVSSTITDRARIENNQAGSEGGGFFVSSASLDISGMVVFVGNKAGASGGAIAARASASVRVSGAAAFVGNTALSLGGAIDADTSVSLRFQGSTSVKRNSAASGGGLSLR